MKTLGCKIPDEIYAKVSSLGPKSDVLRSAIEHYLSHHSKIQVNVVNHDAEADRDVEEYQRLIW
jgi:hypothetical protein